MAILVNIKDYYICNEDYTYHCYNCDNVVKDNDKRLEFGAHGDGGILCMACIYKLHLELNNMFEQAPDKKSLMWKSLAGFTYPINRTI